GYSSAPSADHLYVLLFTFYALHLRRVRKLAQVLIRIDPRVVAIAPAEADAVAADRFGAGQLGVRFQKVRREHPERIVRPPLAHVAAAGARALRAEEAQRVDAPRAVTPVDDERGAVRGKIGVGEVRH